MSDGKQKRKRKSALHLMEGVEQPPQLNEGMLERMKKKQKGTEISIDKLFDGVVSGNRVLLSKAITLAESNLLEHQEATGLLIEKCLPMAGRSIRIGVTGVPGVGKSTFIEALGMFLIEKGHKIAVLAVDPSSERSKGSILGDKTRMENLSSQENAFIRPSPSAGTLGGVTQKTRETIILCEAAGYDIIFVETVGVGQSEVVVKSMVDFFLLLVLAGAGDELQGIKRGIMEMADAVIIHKADGDNMLKAQSKISMYENALHFFPPAESGWTPKVTECSSVTGHHIQNVWEIIIEYIAFVKRNGFFVKNRQEQEIARMYRMLDDYLRNAFFKNPEITKLIREFEHQIRSGNLSPYQAAAQLFAIHAKK